MKTANVLVFLAIMIVIALLILAVALTPKGDVLEPGESRTLRCRSGTMSATVDGAFGTLTCNPVSPLPTPTTTSPLPTIEFPPGTPGIVPTTQS